MSPNSISPLLLAEDDKRSREELEQLAIENLQNIIYQANPELMTSWLPIISSALKAGKIGETLIIGYSQYALGDHAGLKATLRLLEVDYPNESMRELFNFQATLLRIRNEFNFGNFDAIKKLYENMPKIEKHPFNRTEADYFSRHRGSLVSAFFLQDKETFKKHFAEIEKYLNTDYGTIPHLNINSFKSMNAFLEGNYIEANEYALAAIKLADDLRVNGAYSPFEAAYVLADTYLEFGEDNKSLEVTEKYLERAMYYNQYPWISAFHAKLAILRLQSGNVSSALAAIRTGREQIAGSMFNSILSVPLDVHELIIRMQLDDMERINEIIPRLPNIQIAEGFKMALKLHKNPAAMADFVHLFPENNDQEKFRKELTFAVVNMENPRLSTSHLKKAVEYAVPNGYFRAFLNMPPQIKSFILDIATANPSIYLEKLAKAIRVQTAQMSSAPITDHTPLTKRELDVLRRLGTNIPITKIAAALHISNNTIKTHLKNVYRKLNVESRDEAVARGKELSLL